jgi:hypothetical protein
MNKQLLIDKINKVYEENISKFTEWVTDENRKRDYTLNLLSLLPDNMPDPDSIENSAYQVTFNYPLDKILIKNLIKVINEIRINGKKPEPSTPTVDYFGMHRQYKLDDGIRIQLDFKSDVEGSTCHLKRVGEKKVERTEYIYEVKCKNVKER